MRFFNTAGPVNPEDHYYVPGRLDEQELTESQKLDLQQNIINWNFDNYKSEKLL